jgi:tetratricopeptide (TPR) repeat protein
MKQTARRLHIFFICSALVLATIVAFEPVRHNDFVAFDDYTYVTQNEQVRGGLTLDSIVWAFTSRDVAYWHPLTWLSHMLDCQLYGLRPSLHHLTSLILHIANSLLLFLVFKRMTGTIWRSAFVAAMFALHPINVNSVVWVAERKNVLSTLFWLLTMWAYAGYARRGGRGRYLLTLLFYALGLLSKPMLVTLPFVMLLLDYWPLGRFRSEPARDSGGGGRDKAVAAGIQISVLFRLVREKIPFFVLSLVSFYSLYSSVEKSAISVSQVLAPVKLRIANALVSYVNYIGKMIWPAKLAVYYPYPNAVPTFKATGALLLLVCISVLVILALRKKPYLAIGWLWYLGTLVPVIGFYQAGLWPAMANRWAYVPLIGLFVIIAWAVADLVVKWRYRRIVTALSAAVVLSAFVLCTRMQVNRWRDNSTLFEHALKITKNNAPMHNNYGRALLEKGDLDQAVFHLREALRIIPDLFESRYNLGKALLRQGKLNEAIACFTKALQLAKDSPPVHYNFGLALVKQAKYDDAIEHFAEALRIDPKYLDANNAMAIALLATGKPDEAIECFTKALQLGEDSPDIHYNLGQALAMQAKYDAAIKHFAEVLRADPEHLEARNKMGMAYLAAGKFNEAIACFNEVLRSRTDRPDVYVNLGIAYNQLGNYNLAIANWTQAAALKPDSFQVLNNLAWLLATTDDSNLRNPDKAIEYARRACELTHYKQPELLDTLAVAYAAASKFSLAIETAEKAVKLATSANGKKLTSEIQKRLQLYRAGQPYIDKRP